MQLNLFTTPTHQLQQYPWQGIFDWMPKVGGLAQMHSVILPKHGYCYGDTVRIKSIKGQQVTCIVQHQNDKHWWKNGTVYHCTIYDLWPNVYSNRNKNEKNNL